MNSSVVPLFRTNQQPNPNTPTMYAIRTARSTECRFDDTQRGFRILCRACYLLKWKAFSSQRSALSQKASMLQTGKKLTADC